MPQINFCNEVLSDREKKNLNILSVIRRQGPLTRAEISQASGLNLVTVSNYLENMMSRRLVFEKEFDVSEGGRRPILLDINPEAGFVIGVGLNFLNIVGVLLDLKGKIITRVVLERKDVGIRNIIGHISIVVNSVLDKAGEAKSKIRGIGVGIAGIVNKKDGSLRFPEKVDDNYNYASVFVPLKDVLEKEFSLPVFVENDATCACFGEQWLNSDLSIKNLIYMFSGVGCGIMINGEIYTGSTGSAGEVSVYNPKENISFNCQAGNPCFLKRWEIDFGITEEARREAAKPGYSGKLLELASGNPQNINLKLIFQAARENDKFACELLEKAAKQLGVKIAFLVNLLNPQVVVVGGGMEDAPEVFLTALKSTVCDWAFEEMLSVTKIVYSDLGENAVALGAGSLVMRQVFSKTQ